MSDLFQAAPKIRAAKSTSGKRAARRDAEAAYIAGILTATTADELERAVQADFNHTYRGAQWSRISNARIAAGQAICDAHPHGHLVPRWIRSDFIVAGQSLRVGRHPGSYGWAHAKAWAIPILMDHGLSRRAAYDILDSWFNYPHRCLKTIEAALAGKIPDPVLDRLHPRHRYKTVGPIRYTTEQNNADRYDKRASRPCACGGTRFDWGAGWSRGFDFINWHCNGCAYVYTEYLSPRRLTAIRQTGDAFATIKDLEKHRQAATSPDLHAAA